MRIANLTSVQDDYTRWGVSGVISLVILFLVLFLIFFSVPNIKIEEAPQLLLDYIVLQPKKKIQPVKKQPTPPKPKEKVEVPKEILPVAKAEVEADPEPSPNADVQAAPAVTPQKPIPIQITSAEDLDNVEFEPLINIKPSYPAAALRNNITGYVDVDLYINEKGRVDRFALVNIHGHPAFGPACAKVLPKWRFPPPRKNGQKVKVRYIYRINFTLH